MKKTKLLTVIVALGLLAFGASNVLAQPQTVNIRVTLQRQGPSTTHGSVTTDTIIKRSIDTKDLLDLLATATTNTFPKGVTLVLADENIWQVRKGTNILADVSSFFTFVKGDIIDAGTFDQPKENFTDIYVPTLTFNDGHGNTFTFSGLATEHVSEGPIVHGFQTLSDSLTIDGVGTGTIGGNSFIISGKITAIGSGRFPDDSAP
jgi:hypothetical protein